jgi:transcriptional regulator with XRE-family HTH domain
MTGPDLQEMRRALGRELAALRRQAGLTQRQFAPLIGYSRSALSDAELGRYHTLRDFWRRAEAALRAGTALTERYDAIEHRPHSEPAGVACPVCQTRLVVLLAEMPQ